MVAILILFATIKGYEITFGDAWAKEGEGRPHKPGSFHFKRLAIDLNLFKNGKYLPNTKDHEPLGKFWEFIGGTWGGRFKDSKGEPAPDGNHYSWGEY